MEEHHKSFLNAAMGGIGAIASWFGAHKAVINEAVSDFSLYGGAAVVLFSFINAYRQWRRDNRRK